MSQNRDIHESPCFGCTHREAGCHAPGKCKNPEETYAEWRERYDKYLKHIGQKKEEAKAHDDYLIQQHIRIERRYKNHR